MADGCIRDGGELLLNVHMQDREHVERFAAWIGLTAESVYKSSGRMGAGDQAKIHLKHPRLLPDLKPWGVVPRKSYVFTRPAVSDELFPHFTRGWFDGDGCVSLRKGRERCRITGNSKAMEWLVGEVLRRAAVLPRISDRKEGQAWAKFCIGGANNVLRFLEWMQPSSAPRLERKWREASAWVKVRRKMLADCKDGRVIRNNLEHGKQVRPH